VKVDDLIPLPGHKIRFSLADYKLVPKGSGCYVLSTFDNQILYIGMATEFMSRFAKHLDTPEKVQPTADGKAIWFHYLEYPTLQIAQLERTWLNQFANNHGRRPILNKVDSPVA
jgi:hypothetical protein